MGKQLVKVRWLCYSQETITLLSILKDLLVCLICAKGYLAFSVFVRWSVCVNFPQVPSNVSFEVCVQWSGTVPTPVMLNVKVAMNCFRVIELHKCGKKVLQRLCVHGWQLSTSSLICMPDSIRSPRCRFHVKVALTINV